MRRTLTRDTVRCGHAFAAGEPDYLRSSFASGIKRLPCDFGAGRDELPR